MKEQYIKFTAGEEGVYLQTRIRSKEIYYYLIKTMLVYLTTDEDAKEMVEYIRTEDSDGKDYHLEQILEQVKPS